MTLGLFVVANTLISLTASRVTFIKAPTLPLSPSSVLFARDASFHRKAIITNTNINAPHVKLISQRAHEGLEPPEIVSFNEALKRAKDFGSDLVQVDKEAIPTCVIMQAGKYLYHKNIEEKRILKQNVSKSSTVTFKSSENENDTRTNLMKVRLQFVKKGVQHVELKVTAGNKLPMNDYVDRLLKLAAEILKNIASIESPPVSAGLREHIIKAKAAVRGFRT